MWSTSRALWCSWAPQHSQRPLARVSTRTLIEPLNGVRWRLRCANTCSPPAPERHPAAGGTAATVHRARLRSALLLRQKPDGYGADPPVAALQHLRDAVAIEHPAHHPLHALPHARGLMRIRSAKNRLRRWLEGEGVGGWGGMEASGRRQVRAGGDGTGGGTDEEKPSASCHALHQPLPHASTSLPTSRCMTFANCPGFRNRLKLVLLHLSILAGALP